MSIVKPALVAVKEGRVEVTPLVDVDGVLAVPIDGGGYEVGSVYKDKYVLRGLSKVGWFSSTVTGAVLGPFATRAEALEVLLVRGGLRSAEVSETTEPLF